MSITPLGKQLMEELVADSKANGLVLFLGSGINATAVSQWTGLLDSLWEKVFDEASADDELFRDFKGPLKQWCTKLEVCAQAALIKKILGAERYLTEIQHAVYKIDNLEREVKEYCKGRSSGKIVEPNAKYELLWRTACLACLPQVRGVVTFNFDRLLECAIEALSEKSEKKPEEKTLAAKDGLRPKIPYTYFGGVASITEEKEQEEEKERLPIFHVHGLLSSPQAWPHNRNESVVFSLDEYLEKIADPLSWETATPVHMLRHFCTLWLGASLKDWNMLRLLHAANNQGFKIRSYALQCYQEIREELFLSDTEATNFQQLALQLTEPSSTASQPSTDEFKQLAWRLTEPFLNKPLSKEAQQRAQDLTKPPPTAPDNVLKFPRLAQRLQATLFETVGVRLAVVGDKYKEIPDVIEELLIDKLKKKAKP